MTSISRHLMLLALSAVLPVLLMAGVLAYLLVEQDRQSTRHVLDENARLLAHALDAELQRSISALHALSRSESLRRDDLVSFYTEARDVRAALGLWDNVLLLSPSAEHLLNLKRPYGSKLPPVPQPEGTLRAAQTGEPYISGVLKGRVETDWLMYIAFPVLHEGVVRYVIGVTMSSRHWSDWLAERVPEGSAAGIIDRNHVILARSHEADRLVGQPVQPWYRDELAARTTGVLRGPGRADPDVVVAFHRSQLSGWSVNVLVPGAVVDAPIWKTVASLGIALVATLGIAVALALARARRLTSGIRDLHGALEGLRGPNPSLPPQRSAIREIDSALLAANDTAMALNVRGERLLRAQRAAQLGLWDWGLRDGVLEWSEGVYDLFGVTPNSFEPSIARWLELIDPADRARVQSVLSAGSVEVHEEFRIRRADGALRWVACMGRTDKSATGSAARMQGVMIDITDRKQAEELLRRSEEHFRTISQAAPAMVWVAAPSGELVFMNARWYEYTGQSESQAMGYGWTDVAHPEDVSRLLPLWKRCLASGETYEIECRYRRKDGQYRWHASRALPHRGPDGAIEQWFGCSVDIHDAWEARQALQEADRRKDEFLAMLAHELRNPLAPIANAVQLLKLSSVDDKAVHMARDIMDRQVGHMVRLIDDLLDVSRITRGKLELRRQSVELARVIEQALETSRPNIEQKLEVHLPPEPIYVNGDPVRLAQVFSNLLNNAAKYTERSGRISLEAVRAGDTVEVSVSDNGIGIAPEQLPNLFVMFAQARPAIARADGGLGIGLALSRSLVEMHGGTISAHSEGTGRGSRFVVRLPALRAPDTAPDTERLRRVYSNAVCRVLVVDDVPDSIATLAALLRNDGNEVETAADGIQALAKAEAFGPDVILLDLGLPGMSGYEVCRAIRQQPWGSSIYIVAVTGWGQAEDQLRTRAAGFNAHLVKPIDYEAVRAIIAAPSMT